MENARAFVGNTFRLAWFWASSCTRERRSNAPDVRLHVAKQIELN
jgi:hypothetical protein